MKCFDKYPAVSCLILNLLLFAGFFLIFTPVYQTNDDTAMNMIVSGLCLSPESDAHLLYSHIFIGSFLKYLYSISNQIPWYGLYLISAHFIALFFISYALFFKDFNWFKLFFYLLFFFLAELFFLQQIQFTSTALILGFAGSFLLFRGLEFNSRKYLFLAFLVFIIAFMIRPVMVLFVLILASPLFLKAINFKKETILVFSLLFLSFLGLQKANTSAYKNHQGWENFYEWNRYKAALNDYQRADYDSHPEVFNNAGWSEVDYQLFRKWFFAEPKVYGLEPLKEIHQNLPAAQIRSPHVIADYLKKMPFSQMALILFSASLLFFIDIKNRKYILAIQALTIALAIALLLYLKFPIRISYPFICFSILSGILFVKMPLKKWLYGPCLLLFILSIFSFKKNLDRNKKSKKAFNRSSQLIQGLNPQKEQLYVAWTNASAFDNIIQPLNENRNLTEKLNLIYYGGISNTPIYNKQLAHFKISDIHQALYQGENQNLFMLSSPDFLVLYDRFLNLHRGININQHLVHQHKKPDLWLWQLSKKKRTD